MILKESIEVTVRGLLLRRKSLNQLLVKTILLPAFFLLTCTSLASAESGWKGCSNVSEVPVGECEALVALYNSTNGTGWKDNTGWLQTNTPCSWHGVSCSGGNVTQLTLGENRLNGTIPSELANLSRLRKIWLFTNQLSGEIPATLGSLPELQKLKLSGNRLSGNIPEILSNLSELQELNLRVNQLSGEIPAVLANLSELKKLDLYDNKLNGNIPKELGNLSELRQLSLRSNRLNGTIPAALGNLSSLQSLSLCVNRLSGKIPPELGNLSSLQHLDLSNNRLSGDIPLTLGNLSRLEAILMSNNRLSGEIPSTLGNLSRLEMIWMKNNQLSGSIPAALGKLAALQRVDLSNNMLTGKIPQEFGNLSALKSLVLDNNKLNTDISFTLAVNSSGIGEDSVELVGNPEKYSGKTNFSMSNIEKNTVIHLTAPVLAGTWSQRKKLVSWSGCDFMFGRTCAIKMLSNKTVTVKYDVKDSKTADSSNTLKNIFENLKEFDEEYDSRHSKAPDFCNSLEIVLRNPEKLDVRYIVYSYNPINHSGQEGLPEGLRIPESISIISTADIMRDVEWMEHTDTPVYTVIVTEKCDGSTTREVQPGLDGMIHEESTSFKDMKSRIIVTVTSSVDQDSLFAFPFHHQPTKMK